MSKRTPHRKTATQWHVVRNIHSLRLAAELEKLSARGWAVVTILGPLRATAAGGEGFMIVASRVLVAPQEPT